MSCRLQLATAEAKNPPRWRRRLLAVSISIALVNPALADDADRVAELEQRVAELEAMVRTLIDEQPERRAAGERLERVAEESRTTREMVESIRAARSPCWLQPKRNRPARSSITVGI